MNERRVTLADIAKEAGVHVTTVSLALRNHPRLPEQTRRRIQAIAEKMGYRPDPLLQALVAYRGNVAAHRHPPTLAYVTNWSSRYGWKKTTAHPDFFAGAASKAHELGYNLEHFWMGEPGMSHTRLSKILQARGIKGLIIASHMREFDGALHFDWPSFSAVKIDYFPHKPELHNVTNNQCSIVRLAMQRVMKLGYRRIGMVMHRGWDHSVDHLWTAGFLCQQVELAAEDHIPIYMFPELNPVENWLNESKTHVVAPRESFERWFREFRPEVIISKKSFLEPVFEEMKLKLPKDVAFVDLFLEDTAGKLAGVRQNHATVGELAVEILGGQLHHNKFGIPEIATTTYVEGTWFDGESCPRKANEE